jgi:phosphate acetyltransferase
MKSNIYITWAEKGSSKSSIILATMDMLVGTFAKVGFFRPIIMNKNDYSRDTLYNLISSRYELADRISYGVTIDEALEYLDNNRHEALQKVILQKFRELEMHCNTVLCVGTDHTVYSDAIAFEFNSEVAKNLGSYLVPIIRAQGRSAESVYSNYNAIYYLLKSTGVKILMSVLNRVDRSEITQLQKKIANSDDTYIIPNKINLSYPTIMDVSDALGAKLLYGESSLLHHEIKGFKVAAMRLPGFLNTLKEGDLIITPADRVDIVLGSLLSLSSEGFTNIAGILLTGSDMLPPSVDKLIKGLKEISIPILKVKYDTYKVASSISEIEVHLNITNRSKIEKTIREVENNLPFEKIKNLLLEKKSTRVITPLMFEYELLNRAKSNKKHIVLPEGDEIRTLKAAEILLLRDVVDITFLGDVDTIKEKISASKLQLKNVNIINPIDSHLRKLFAKHYFKLRKHKNITMQHAFDNMGNVSYFATMYVHLGYADGMVSGAVHTTQETVRPALEIVKTDEESSIVSSCFFMALADRVLIYADCAINPNPNDEELADIAISSAKTASQFGIDPKVAMLSYSTGSSGKGSMVQKVVSATKIAQAKNPELLLEGPMQYDAAINVDVGKNKLPNSKVAGEATVFIFPDLNTGNNTYKAVQRSANALAIGPILQGLNKPINDLSRGCSVDDIVNTIAITAIQAQR